MTDQKKSRKAIHNYTFSSSNGEVEVDLNNYQAICSVTGSAKQFHHTYLANMIVNKFDGNIDTFRDTYVSREGRAEGSNLRKAEVVKAKIDRLYNQINELKIKRDQLLIVE